MSLGDDARMCAQWRHWWLSHLDPEYIFKHKNKKEIERLGVDEEKISGIDNICLGEKHISFHDDESQRNEPNWLMQTKTMSSIFASTTIWLRSSMLSSGSSLPFRRTSITIRSENDSPERVREKPFRDPASHYLQVPGVSVSPDWSQLAPPPGLGRDSDNLSSESSVVVFPAAWPGAPGAAKTTWLRSVSTLYRILTPLCSSLQSPGQVTQLSCWQGDQSGAGCVSKQTRTRLCKLRTHFVWSLLEPEHGDTIQ